MIHSRFHNIHIFQRHGKITKPARSNIPAFESAATVSWTNAPNLWAILRKCLSDPDKSPAVGKPGKTPLSCSPFGNFWISPSQRLLATIDWTFWWSFLEKTTFSLKWDCIELRKTAKMLLENIIIAFQVIWCVFNYDINSLEIAVRARYT